LALKTILGVVTAYFATSFVVLLCGYLFPAQDEFVNSVPILVSLLLLIPIYAWHRSYSRKAELSKETVKNDKGAVLMWILALFVLALSVRVPSVLLYGIPLEKTPVILLTILVIIVIEKTDASAFGFTTRGFGKSLFYGLSFFVFFYAVAQVIFCALAYAFTNQLLVQSYNPTPFLSTLPFMTLCVGISEEGLFRGYMQTHLEKLFTSRKAIVIQALLFGVWHFVWNLSPFDLFAMAQYVGYTFFAGLLFGYFYSKTKNLIPVVFAHGLLDSLPQGIAENKSAFDAIGTLPFSIQALTFALPYVVATILTVFFIKHFVKRITID
jgi:membrane protease YdiL (CAAX protease family)